MDIVNAFSVDLEDYFMVTAFSRSVKFEEWGRFEERVEVGTRKLLDILDRHGVRATFFVLGWIAERRADLVREIRDAGHEIASHGYNHRMILDMSKGEFRADVRRSKAILEDAIGGRVHGYRAPSYSITGKTLWALGILEEEGFSYDSSIFPIRHDRYGYPGFSRFPVKVTGRGNAGGIREIPLSTIRIGGQNVPVAGGGYFRLYPVEVTVWAIRRINELEKRPAVFYIHPWELDPGQPRMPAGRLTQLRHRLNIGTTERKLGTLLERFRFGPVSDLVDLA
jgi:polysaccharide deacetylase family protein (PEP-CTERM system associated)